MRKVPEHGSLNRNSGARKLKNKEALASDQVLIHGIQSMNKKKPTGSAYQVLITPHKARRIRIPHRPPGRSKQKKKKKESKQNRVKDVPVAGEKVFSG